MGSVLAGMLSERYVRREAERLTAKLVELKSQCKDSSVENTMNANAVAAAMLVFDLQEPSAADCVSYNPYTVTRQAVRRAFAAKTVAWRPDKHQVKGELESPTAFKERQDKAKTKTQELNNHYTLLYAFIDGRDSTSVAYWQSIRWQITEVFDYKVTQLQKLTRSS